MYKIKSRGFPGYNIEDFKEIINDLKNKQKWV
jgi:hypothetical protein